MGQIPPPRSPLARRLTLALATMLLPVAAVAAAGLVTFRFSISALEEFRQETVEESKRIEAVRKLLVQADDLGEAAVEESDPATGKQFLALSALIDRHFDDLQTLATQQERQLAANADALWEKSAADIEAPKAAPKASATDDRLDPFHDHIDQAASRLATSTRSTAIRSRTRSRHCDGGSRHSCWPAWPRSSSARLSRYSWPDGWAARSPDRCCR